MKAEVIDNFVASLTKEQAETLLEIEQNPNIEDDEPGMDAVNYLPEALLRKLGK